MAAAIPTTVVDQEGIMTAYTEGYFRYSMSPLFAPVELTMSASGTKRTVLTGNDA